MRIECDNPIAVVEEAFWLAWKACGRTSGMGFLQNRPEATKEQVIGNIMQSGDYPGGDIGLARPGNVYADYVFGRMMKVGLKWDNTSVTCRDDEPAADYQAWCRVYPTFRALVEAAIASIQRQPS